MSGVANKLMGAAGAGEPEGAWDLSYAYYDPPNAWDISTSRQTLARSVSAEEINPTGIFFKPDGLKMYVVGTTGDDVNEYNLSEAWVVTTETFVQAFSVASQEIVPEGLFFKPDGLKMYIVGSAGDDVNEYDLSTAWDVSTASFLQSFSVSGQDTAPQDVFFKPDGLKMYVVGSGSNRVNEYDLTTAWDISTASFLQNFSVAAQDGTPTGMSFKPDGLKMYVIGQGSDNVNEYNLTTAWDVSTASFLQSFSVGVDDITPQAVFFKPDGTAFYMVGQENDNVYQYAVGGFSVRSQTSQPNSVFFRADGTKMYITGVNQHEYNLSVAWDVSTASFVQSFSIAAPTGVSFKSDGTKMYVLGNGVPDSVYEYDLSTAWDTSTASLLQSFDVSAQDANVAGLYIRANGTKMYVLGAVNDTVFEYNISTAWDISTASFVQGFDVSAQDTLPSGVFFKSDGTKMYVAGDAGNDVNEYDLSTAWDISTASFSQRFSVVGQEATIEDVFFKPDGTQMFIVGSDSDTVYPYTLGVQP
jgi:DNA-binding beta-propeller fold protein YncE